MSMLSSQVLGEYSYLSEDFAATDVLATLCALLDRSFESEYCVAHAHVVQQYSHDV